MRENSAVVGGRQFFLLLLLLLLLWQADVPRGVVRDVMRDIGGTRRRWRVGAEPMGPFSSRSRLARLLVALLIACVLSIALMLACVRARAGENKIVSGAPM